MLTSQTIYYLQNGVIMKNSKKAFTMIELIFVIVVLGILAAIAVPKMAATRDDANIAKGRSDIASIRSAIVTERQTRLIQGDNSWINSLSSSSDPLFDGNDTNHTLLMYGIASGTTDGHWQTTSASFPYVLYSFKVLGTDNTFTYNPTSATITVGTVSVPAGGFVCTAGASCDQLTK